MRIIKSFVMAAVSLLALESLSPAEMTAMSLQERRSQSDAVVVGTIEEVHQTDAGVGGQFPPPVTHWLATCRVERYIIGPKIHNPNVEEAKAVRLIRIAFQERLLEPAPVPLKLVAGKKYLLYLKETGPNEYEMITPYHGAFEAEQEYFVHDEQSPEYPQALKLSFEEIVQRVTPQSPTSLPPSDQVKTSQPLMLTIQSDKKVYGAGEEIGLSLEFKNSGTQNLWLFTKMLPQADLNLRLYKIDGGEKKDVSPPVKIDVIRQIVAERDFVELPPKKIFSKQITLRDFSKELSLEIGVYEIGIELNLDQYLFKNLNVTPWTGSIHSNTIAIEVREKDKKGADIRGQPDRELPGDELRMKERLIALSRGEGDVADLRVELNDGGRLRHRNDTIANGKIISQEWDLAVPPKSEERAVTDEEIRQLLRTLIEHKYWTFKGTKFIPDAPRFMFRFHYKDLSLVKYRCDAHEYEPSAQLSAIRSLWLSFVSGVPLQDQASCEAQGGRWGRFGLMEKEQCNRPTADAGKKCSDHDECESNCVTDDSVPADTEVTGKCFEWTVTLGRCLNGVKDGKAQGVICAD